MSEMASYFDEHDCEPSAPEREARTNILLEIARWVRGAGRAAGRGCPGRGWLEKAGDLGRQSRGRTEE